MTDEGDRHSVRQQPVHRNPPHLLRGMGIPHDNASMPHSCGAQQLAAWQLAGEAPGDTATIVLRVGVWRVGWPERQYNRQYNAKNVFRNVLKTDKQIHQMILGEDPKPDQDRRSHRHRNEGQRLEASGWRLARSEKLEARGQRLEARGQRLEARG